MHLTNFSRNAILPLALLITTLSPHALARWASFDDATVVDRFRTVDTIVHRDGTTESTVEQEKEILREAGRAAGTAKLTYSGESEELKVLDAATINGESRFPVPDKDIEDKPLSSGESGFDSSRQILISFPNVVVGSKIHVKYRRRVRVPPIAGFFSLRFDAAANVPIGKQRMTIRSALPLHWEPIDPKGLVAVSRKEMSGEHLMQIEVDKPILESAVDEENPIFLRSDRTGGIISSDPSPASAFASLAEQYDIELAKPLPPAFAAIAEEAAKVTPGTAQIDLVTTRLNEKVRYMGDWRTVRGKFVPRGHETVVKTGAGDCKDFSTSTAAILRALGIDARLALVERGQHPDAMPGLPMLSAFNHVIVRARVAGRTLWVDPTSDRSFADGIPEDIMDRKALVLDSKSSAFDAIPAGKPGDSLWHTKVSIHWHSEEAQDLAWNMRLKGIPAWIWTGVERNVSKKSLDEMLLGQVASTEETVSYKLHPYELRSRVTRELDFGGTARTRFRTVRTSAGLAFSGRGDTLGPQLAAQDWTTRATRFHLGYPRTIIRETELTGARIVGRKLVSCEADAPWLRLTRTFRPTLNGIRTEERVEIRSRYLDPQHFKSAAFGDWVARLKRCVWPWFILELSARKKP